MTKTKADPNHLYDSLKRVLQGAADQASDGKGKERHADDEPFQYQKICVINRWLEGSPVAGALFQAVKKTVESSRLSDSAAIHELQGAINYLAAAIILLEERPEVEERMEPFGGKFLFNPTEADEKEPEEFAQIKLIYRPDNRLADSTPAGDRVCVSCEHVDIRVDDTPCNKCIQWDFKPHFRLVESA
jgi:hypothetical protein